jgi:hypothetical protein
LNEREQKVRDAWGKAYAEIAAFYPQDGIELQPQMLRRLNAAELNAEEISVRWQEGGPGGVQAAINMWRDLWREAVSG